MFAFRDVIPAALTLLWVLPRLVRGTKEEQQGWVYTFSSPDAPFCFTHPLCLSLRQFSALQATQTCAQEREELPQEQLGRPWEGAVDLQTTRARFRLRVSLLHLRG